MPKFDKSFTSVLIALLVAVVIGGAITYGFATRNDNAAQPNKPLQGAGNGSAGNPQKPNDKPKSEGNGESKKDFTISSTSPLLYPGANANLALTVKNTNNFPIRVTELRTVTTNASVAGCTPSSVITDALNGSLVVPKNGSATTNVSIRMSAGVPNACQGAQFTLSFSGIGEKA